MIPEPFLRWATSGPYDEKYIALLILRHEKRVAIEAEHKLVQEIFKESNRRLEMLQKAFSCSPELKDVLDSILEDNL